MIGIINRLKQWITFLIKELTCYYFIMFQQRLYKFKVIVYHTYFFLLPNIDLIENLLF